MSIFNRAKLPGVTPSSPGFGTELASPGGVCAVEERHAWIEAPIERRVMSRFIRKMSRRAIVQALIALPALSLFRNQPAPANPDEIDRDEIVEINGWILRRSDLA